MKESISQQLLEIYRDNTSGSTEILNRLIKILSDPELRLLSKEDFRRTISRSKEELSAFAIVQHFLDYLQDRSASQEYAPNTWVDAYTKTWQDATEKIAEVFLKSVNVQSRRILLHSKSGSIIQVMTRAVSDYDFEVYQTESRPVYEGREQGLVLSDLGIKVTIITEAMIPEYVQKCDFAIIGADVVYRESFINKVGSHIIARFCKDMGKPFYLIADPRKIRDQRATDYEDRQRSPDEIWEQAPLAVDNHYFEKVTLDLVSEVFTLKDKAL